MFSPCPDVVLWAFGCKEDAASVAALPIKETPLRLAVAIATAQTGTTSRPRSFFMSPNGSLHSFGMHNAFRKYFHTFR